MVYLVFVVQRRMKMDSVVAMGISVALAQAQVPASPPWYSSLTTHCRHICKEATAHFCPAGVVFLKQMIFLHSNNSTKGNFIS